MTISFTNTLSREKEVFVPIDENHIRMYVCGPTVYDFAHLGNARPVVVFDVLYRLLKRHYSSVVYVRNITDIDDKIMAKSKASGEPIKLITERTIAAYNEDMASLNALPPDFTPKATDCIPQMIALIQELVKKKHAYVAERHVLFNVPSMKNYGELSRRPRDELIAGARVDVAPYKKDPADFVLWKPSSEDQPGWESPFGFGRPGWHIECSAMAKEFLGETFDIHGGGLDLIFPHHENEIAQSRSAHQGAPLAKYWLHNGFLIISGDKMSKSLGNFFTVRDLLAKAPGEALRLSLLSAHYRQPLDFSVAALEQSKATLDRWYGALRTAAKDASPALSKPSAPIEALLSDDLNTPGTIAAIHELVTALNSTSDSAARKALFGEILAAGQALGLLLQDPETWFKGGQDHKGPKDQDIEREISERAEAKRAKNFAEADRIRKALADEGVILEDSPSGTIWRRV